MTQKPDMYLQRRNAVYWFRRRVPGGLADKLTKQDRSAFHHSLFTKERREAIELLPGRIATTEAILRRIKNRGDLPALEGTATGRKNRQAKRVRSRSFYQLTEMDVTKLLNDWFAKSLTETRELFLDVHVHSDAEGRREPPKRRASPKRSGKASATNPDASITTS